MKALFVGLGSIGQRHLRNLKVLVPDAKILAYRKSRDVPVLDNKNNPILNSDLAKYYNLDEYDSLNEGLRQKPNMVFVTNPSRFHAETVIAAMESGAFVFVEKPFSCDMESAKKIVNLEEELGKKLCMVGFQYRYSPTLIKLKEIIENNTIGNLINGQIANGEYLPYWHPYEDYRKSYASLKNLGGGAILSQIHDFDYSIYLFGMPKCIYAIGGKLSELDIDVEDSVNIATTFDYKNSILPINLSLDYVSWPSRRYIKLYGENGSINCNLNTNIIEVNLRKNKKINKYDFSSITRNEIFIKELQNFISFAKGEDQPKVDAREGLKSLEFALAAKYSLKKGVPLNIELHN